MSIATLTDIARRELAHRVSGGLEITLYWTAHDNSTSIEVHQSTSGETISFPVPAERALDAYHHPFAHLAEQDAAFTAFDRHEALDEATTFGRGAVES